MNYLLHKSKTNRAKKGNIIIAILKVWVLNFIGLSGKIAFKTTPKISKNGIKSKLPIIFKTKDLLFKSSIETIKIAIIPPNKPKFGTSIIISPLVLLYQKRLQYE
ncbi:hypothetical protein [Campylobacter corcagiensis]|uniref:Uncharacterized protein n=1 Tax=Campylobacter corcagiensis TaxID=1448857 RepID=A0A7M1LFR7_9BACT|nr:hypothetical protein [Campylobacter corcagiensis]QKF64555.1 hypothetical protein CCORG_0694 [Campylobacter corcagiensis]QOQ87270.1 hypothetical protein IMC76_08700 [Campylobacter corcagiensis]